MVWNIRVIILILVFPTVYGILETTDGSGEADITSISMTTLDDIDEYIPVSTEASSATAGNILTTDHTDYLTDLTTSELMTSPQSEISDDVSTQSHGVTSHVTIGTDNLTTVVPTIVGQTTTISPSESTLAQGGVETTVSVEFTTMTRQNQPSSPSDVTSSLPLENTTVVISRMTTAAIDTSSASDRLTSETVTTVSTRFSTDGGGGTTDTDVVETTTTVSIPPSTICNRIEPCLPGSKLADPLDCIAYYECHSNLTWQLRSCGNRIFDVVTEACSDTVTCTQHCASTPTHEPTFTAGPTTSTPVSGQIINHQITMESDDAIAGEELVSQCSFSVQPDGVPFRVVWYLNNALVRPSDRIHITGLVPGPTTRNTHTSSLTFEPVYATDTGMLSCYVELTNTEVNSEMTLAFSVLALPITTLTPTTTVIYHNEQITLTCRATLQQTGHPLDQNSAHIRWYKNGQLVTTDDEDIIDSDGMSELTTYPTNDAVYSCAAYNGPNITQDEGPWSNSSVYVLDAHQPVCDEETIDGISWPMTGAGIVNVQLCPGDMFGKARRTCVFDGSDGAEWAEPYLMDCVSQAFFNISQQINRLEDGIGGPDDSEEIAQTLQEITNTSSALPAGDLNSATDSVSSLAEIRLQENVVNVELSDTEMMSMMNTVSNLLNEMNDQSWTTVTKEYPDKAVSLMFTVETYSDIYAHQMAVNETMSIVTPMLAIQMDALSIDSTRDLRYPTTSWDDEEHSDVISLNKETLDQISENLADDKISVSSSYYRTLNRLLPSWANYTDTYIDSRVLALSVAGRPQTGLDPPVRMSFTHNTVPDEKVAKCSYWDYSSKMWSTDGCRVVDSKSTQTTCECDHLTNFAILVSKEPLEGKHANVLGIISIVGCVISIAGLLLTILIYISIWKHVKSHHAVVLINLCIALLIANLIFVTGVDKADHEDICTAIAALLHYFYLAAFCIMLVEGIQLVLYILYVFHVRRKRETALMLILAWVVPAAVVGICLAITKTEGYGTEDYCWLDTDSWVFWMFIVPIVIIILINIGILIAVLRRISTSKLHQIDKNRNQRIRSSAWNIVVILPILGITWIFGLFSLNSDIVAFQYIFAIANSLQGLFIFIFHAICNKKVRDALTNSLPSSASASSSGLKNPFVPGKLKAASHKANYQVKTNSQRTQRSRLKSDSSGKNSTKLDKKSKKGFMEKSKKRNPSTENPYDTIPAEYVSAKATPGGKLAVENEYTVPDENNRLSCFNTFMLPEEIKANTFDTSHPSNGINHNPFDAYIVPEENKNGNRNGVLPKIRTQSEDSNYMVPVSQKDIDVGFMNPAYSDTDYEQVNLTFNVSKNIQDTSLTTPRNNGVVRDRDINMPNGLDTKEFNTPPPYHKAVNRSLTPPRLENGPPSYHTSLQHSIGQPFSNSSSPHTIKHEGDLARENSNISFERHVRQDGPNRSLPRTIIHEDSNNSLPRFVRNDEYSSSVQWGLTQENSLPRHLQHTDSDSSSVISRGIKQSDLNSLQRGLWQTDSNSSLQRAALQARKAEQMRPDECIDMSLRKQDSPRHTPKSSPYLPRSTPFLAKQGF